MSQFSTAVKWFYPGLLIKRWLVLGFMGFVVFLIGVGVTIQSHPIESSPLVVQFSNWIILRTQGLVRPRVLGLALSGIGAVVGISALARLILSLTSVLDPDLEHGDLVDVIYERRRLSKGRRIVVIGGGTGLSTMLRGLKRYSHNITAIVTVTDDGGSSGKLQKQLNILPPGDIRNCLVALADAEPQMTELFQYRFRDTVHKVVRVESAVAEPLGSIRGSSVAEMEVPIQNRREGNSFGEGLRDHAFGNLLIAAMCAIYDGDFKRGVEETSRVLNIRGRVLPSTVSHVFLRGEMEDGSILEGETAIASSPLHIKRVSLCPANTRPIEDVLEAIEKADVIVLGPGSVYTSIIPNLLVKDIPEAMHRSKAIKIYVCNVMTQPGETDGYSAYDHIRALELHARQRVFDYVLVNTGEPNPELLLKYEQTGSDLVEADTDRIKKEGYKPIKGNFINQTDVVRHDSARLAEAIMSLLDKKHK